MSTAQAERAISQLYESDSLRSEVRDEEASLLLMWGEARLNELAKRDLPDSQFDHVSEKFRSLLAAINVCVGKRKTSPSQHLPMMASISSAAEAAGYALTPDDQTTFLKQQSALTNQDAISELLGLLKPAELPNPPSQNIGEAVAEIITPLSPPVDNMFPPQPDDLFEPPPSQNMTEQEAEIITPQPLPAVVESILPSEPENPFDAQPPSQNMTEQEAEIITPQPLPAVVESILPSQPESPFEPPPPQNMGESTAEIIMPQPLPVDNTLPPQPEDLPEFLQQPPPLESYDDD